MAGAPYISCLNTSKEWSEEEFEEATGCKCTYCKNPIGDLGEVHQIFVNRHPPHKEEAVTFLCTTCFKDSKKVKVA